MGEVDTDVLLQAVDGIDWITAEYYRPDRRFLRDIGDRVRRWVIIAPQAQTRTEIRNLPGVGTRTIFKRALKAPAYMDPTRSASSRR